VDIGVYFTGHRPGNGSSKIIETKTESIFSYTYCKISFMKLLKNISFVAIGIITCFIISGSCVPKKYINVTTKFLGQTQTILVSDSMTMQILQGNTPDDFIAFDNQNLTNTLLHEISQKYSLDVATIYALNRLYEIPQNKEAQNHYLSFIDSIKNNIAPIQIEKLKSKYFLFIPGFGYKEDATTGADLARQRRLFSDLGLENKLIETNEYGLSESNAQIIANEIIEASKFKTDIVLVSASKGGLETAIALGKLLNKEQLQNVSAWVSVGGILKGSPIADQYLKSPKRWIAQFILWTKGQNMEVVKDISHSFRSEAFKSLDFPVHIKAIHFVGIPLTSQVHKRIKGRYCTIRKSFGPNDGLTTIPDALTPQGLVVSELGLDHYFKDENIDIKTLALACLLGEKGNNKIARNLKPGL
jgi:hypothetical protein